MNRPEGEGLKNTRRVFLGRAGRSLGSVARASLLNPGLLRAAEAVASAGKPWRGVGVTRCFCACSGWARGYDAAEP